MRASWTNGPKASAELITPEATSREKVHCLARYLGQEQGLGGCGDDYYHPRNGYLPWAMEFRCGLPITLTLIYMLVGMRLNIPSKASRRRAIFSPGSTALFSIRTARAACSPTANGR